MIQDGKETEIMGRKFTVPSLSHLIALKLHALKNNPEVRERWDLRDILELIKVNRVNVETDAFQDLCLEYGTEGDLPQNQGVCKQMEKLNFPVFKEPPPPPPILSMNEYAKFVRFFIEKNLLKRDAYEEERRKAAVNVPFRLK